MSDKASFFEKLYALNESDSDGEPNEARQFLQNCIRPILSTTQEPSLLPPPRKTQRPFRKVPTIQRSHSEPKPIVSLPKEAPEPIRKRSGLRSGSRISVSAGSSFEKETSSPLRSGDSANTRPAAERRSLSNPTLNTLVLTNSTGIASMLTKKRKREPTIKLVSEAARIFQGLEFYFLPNDDKSPVRRARITKARERGATWTKEWTPNTTHLIVDESLTKKDVLQYFKIETLPPNIITVNMSYLLDCIEYQRLFDPNQKSYQVKDPDAATEKGQASTSKKADNSSQLKDSRNKFNSWEPPKQTPPRSAPSTQTDHSQQLPVGPVNSDQSAIEDLNQGAPLKPVEKAPSSITTNQEFGILKEFIDLAKETEDLPLEDEDATNEVEDLDESDDNDGSKSPLKAPSSRRVKRPRGKGLDLASFQCMTGGTAMTNQPNPNAHLIEILQRMSDFYRRTGDQWRERSYKLACGKLRRENRPICTYDDAIVIPSIGASIAAKIEEINCTGHLRKLDHAESENNYASLSLFMEIYGVNKVQASKWVQQGHRTLDDLKQNVKLNANQITGIEHYDDLRQRIPRDEVTALGQYIKDAASKISPEIEIIIGGSYRRGAKTSGDIDIILTKPHTKSTSELMPFLHTLVTSLEKTEFLVAALAVPHNEDGSKWHGCCILPSLPKDQQIWRRIDFLLVPTTEMGAALIYFTGDDVFNRSLRLLAGKLGMRLNQRGLYGEVMRGKGRGKVTEGRLVEGRDERRIFEILGVPWREPCERVLY